MLKVCKTIGIQMIETKALNVRNFSNNNSSIDQQILKSNAYALSI